MIRYFSFLLIFTFSLIVSESQTQSCLDEFASFDVLSPEITNPNTNYVYPPVISWYSNDQCLLVGLSNGLWLYDVERVNSPVQLAAISAKSITNIAVNPANMNIAFSVQEESLVYVINSEGNTATLEVTGDAVTNISFSPDGQLLAIASSELAELEGTMFYVESRIEIWDSGQNLILTIPTNNSGIAGIFFSTNNEDLLFHSYDSGYIGDNVEYWNITTNTRLWTYYDLMRDNFTINDPMAISMVTMRDDRVFFGGLYGYMDWDDYYGTAVQIWNTETMARESEIIVNRRGGAENDQNLQAFSLNCDGSELATAQSGGIIRIWQLENSSEISDFVQPDTQIYSVLYSPSCVHLAIVAEHEVMILNLERIELETIIETK